MPDDDLPADSPWHRADIVLDDEQVSRDAANFMASYDDPDERFEDLHEIFGKHFDGDNELTRHWVAVARRVQEIAAAGRERLN